MKKVKITTTIALVIMAVVTTVNITLLASYEMLNEKQGEYQKMQEELSKIYEVMDVVDKLYVGEVDVQGAIDEACAGYIAGMGDRWSYYLTADQYLEYQEDAYANLVGIGVSVVYDSSEQAILVTEVYNDSPASRVGIEKLDYIVAVNSQKISDIGYQQAVALVSGEEGTTVSIEILRNGITQTVEATRATVTKVSVSLEILSDNIAYIKISGFENETANQFENAVNAAIELGAEGFIFDVRNNPGGYLTKLIECLDILLPEGNVISTVSKIGTEEIYTSDANMLGMPIAVIINQASYSAAEFFAAAIQEYEVGTIVGTNTTGKGYTQSPIELSDGSAIVLSTNKYYTPKGNNLADVGVTPDIVVDLTDEQIENFYFLTNDTDPQILAAVKEVELQLLK